MDGITDLLLVAAHVLPHSEEGEVYMYRVNKQVREVSRLHKVAEAVATQPPAE